MKEVKLSLIRTDGGTQMRANIQTDVFMEYRDVWLNGAKLPPVDVFYDGTVYWLADGFHRFYGAREAKRETIPATVHQGTVRDAILFAAGANVGHGLRRSNADKRRSVEALLNDEEWVKQSDNWIAEKSSVSQEFVRQRRAELTTVVGSAASKQADKPRIGKDGKARKPPKKSGAVSEYFDSKPNGKAPPKKTKPKEVNTAKAVDLVTTSYISPAIREIDNIAENLGWKRKSARTGNHLAANDALNALLAALKGMRKGEL